MDDADQQSGSSEFLRNPVSRDDKKNRATSQERCRIPLAALLTYNRRVGQIL
jgi:hypothetical protein